MWGNEHDPNVHVLKKYSLILIMFLNPHLLDSVVTTNFSNNMILLAMDQLLILVHPFSQKIMLRDHRFLESYFYLNIKKIVANIASSINNK